MDNWYNRELLRHQGWYDDADVNASRRRKIKEQLENTDKCLDTLTDMSDGHGTNTNKGDENG